jgi:hypothetical protein
MEIKPPPFQSRLALGDQERIIKQYIRPHWARFVAETWEQLARDFLAPAGMADRLPFIAEEVGKWWSRDWEIDIVGVDRHSRRAILGEARWQERPVGEAALTQLLGKARHWRQNARGWRVAYALFSRSGFTREVEQLAADQPDEVYLFGPKDLVHLTG